MLTPMPNSTNTTSIKSALKRMDSEQRTQERIRFWTKEVERLSIEHRLAVGRVAASRRALHSARSTLGRIQNSLRR